MVLTVYHFNTSKLTRLKTRKKYRKGLQLFMLLLLAGNYPRPYIAVASAETTPDGGTTGSGLPPCTLPIIHPFPPIPMQTLRRVTTEEM